MRALALLLSALGLLTALPARAQVVDPELFGDGKAPTYREEETDRRFLKTGIYAGLAAPPREKACQRVLASLLVAYSDALLYLHRKDQNFYVDPALLQTLNHTAGSEQFPVQAYLAVMIRRTLIDKRVPAAWVATSEALRKEYAAPIEVERMKLFSSGVAPVESFLFTVPALLDRYGREVKLATSVAADAADDRFRDKYMDRDIAWGGLILHDIAQEAPPEPPKDKKGRRKAEPLPEEQEPLHTWAVVGFPVGKPLPTVPGVPGGGEVPMLRINARLKEGQPHDLSKFARGQRVLVKGHLWDIGPNMAWVEVRDAVIFPDVDWSTWPGLASPEDVASCPIAVNDLSPYGFRSHPGKGQPDPFTHTRE